MSRPWDIVALAWDNQVRECSECEYYCYQYYSDTGFNAWCNLLEKGGEAAFCAAFDRLEEEKADE